MNDAHWYTPLSSLASLGSTAQRPGSLAGLHAARERCLGQFYTPSAVAALIWRIASPALDAAIARSPGSKVSLLDTSVGTGRLFQFADSARHTLAGCDVHQPSINALADAVEAAGFDCDLVCGGLEAVSPKRFGCALLNPPFSLHLQSPTLRPLPCTGWGRFGPHSSAVSHAYAVDQALAGCDMVLAVVPTSYAETRVREELADDGTHPRLRGCLRLPVGSFREEGTDVDVSLLVYGPAREPRPPVRVTLRTVAEALPEFALDCANTHERRPRPLSVTTIEASRPSITGPVTGDPCVRVGHSGRKIGLRFGCAFTRARVMNAILRRPVSCGDTTHRYPKGVRFAGQGALDLEAHLIQTDPETSFESLIQTIRAAGGEPLVDPGLRNHLRKRARLRARQRTPLRHVAQGLGPTVTAGMEIPAVVLANRQINPKRWGSGLLRKGETHRLAFDGTHYTLLHPTTGERLVMEETEVRAGFALQIDDTAQWRVVHAGRCAAYPEIAAAVRGRMRAAGVHQVTNWGFQLDDIAESSIAPGVTLAWAVGCGKTRGLLGLALMGGRRNAVVIEAHLVAEFLEQVVEIGLSESDYQVITTPEQCDRSRLRRINIITPSRLRQEICPGAGRRTYASLLRRAFSRVLVDEAHFLRSPSDQSRAVWMLSPRTRYAATATPIASYPRDLLGLAAWCAGDGTANQPFGRHQPMMEQPLVRSMDYAETGAHRFKDRHCAYTWVTHQHIESGLRTGAKREIPRARNLADLRAWAATFLLRRLVAEPDVAGHFHSPTFEVREHEVEFDPDHAAWFLTVADDFADYYVRARRDADSANRGLNLVTLLVRLGHLGRAGTFPQHGVPNFGRLGRLTSKQRAVLDRCEELTAQGHKTIIFVEQPETVEMFVRELDRRGIEAVPFHGKLPIVARTRAMNTRFRRGPAPVMVATIGVCQTGLNLWAADRALYLCRTWLWKDVVQTMGRLLRPQQTSHVIFEFFNLKGTIDCYQAQMLAHKRDAANATLDLLTPELEDEEFAHVESFIDRFVAELAERRAVTPSAMRQEIKRRGRRQLPAMVPPALSIEPVEDATP